MRYLARFFWASVLFGVYEAPLCYSVGKLLTRAHHDINHLDTSIRVLALVIASHFHTSIPLNLVLRLGDLGQVSVN
jgi:hypothetical protein